MLAVVCTLGWVQVGPHHAGASHYRLFVFPLLTLGGGLWRPRCEIDILVAIDLYGIVDGRRILHRSADESASRAAGGLDGQDRRQAADIVKKGRRGNFFQALKRVFDLLLLAGLFFVRQARNLPPCLMTHQPLKRHQSSVRSLGTQSPGLFALLI